MIKHEKHIIDKRGQDNSNDFFRSLVKSLKITFLHPMWRSMSMLLFKMRNFEELKNAVLSIFPVVSIQKQSPGDVLQKSCP